MMDNRRESRVAMHGRFANKYIGGLPYTVELIDASMDGVFVRRISEPNLPREDEPDAFALELSVTDEQSQTPRPFWAWAKRVRRVGDREAYQILAASSIDRARLKKFLRTLAA